MKPPPKLGCSRVVNDDGPKGPQHCPITVAQNVSDRRLVRPVGDKWLGRVSFDARNIAGQTASGLGDAYRGPVKPLVKNVGESGYKRSSGGGFNSFCPR